jgi:hypothetical protein
MQEQPYQRKICRPFISRHHQHNTIFLLEMTKIIDAIWLDSKALGYVYKYRNDNDKNIYVSIFLLLKKHNRK